MRFNRILHVLTFAIVSLAASAAAPAFALELSEIEEAYLKIVRKVRPTVVHLEFSKTFRGMTVSYLSSTGVVLDNDGTIVTLSRSILRDSDVAVEVQGRESRKGELLGIDKLTGIVVVKVDCEGLEVTGIGNSAEVEPGQFIVSSGNALGVKGNVYYGYVMGTGRTLISNTFIYSDMIQISTPVKPGDPGGPVVDSKGDIIGIVSRALLRSSRIDVNVGGRGFSKTMERVGRQQDKVTGRRLRRSGGIRLSGRRKEEAGKSNEPAKKQPESSGEEEGRKDEESSKRKSQIDIIQELQSRSQSGGANFALPINFVMNIVSKIKKHGCVERPQLGVHVVALPMGLKREFQIEDDGVVVSDVLSGSPAEKAGLKVRDVITHFDSEAISQLHELKMKIMNADVGRNASLTVIRNGEKMEIKVELQPAPSRKKPAGSGERRSSPRLQPAPDEDGEK